MNSITTVAAYKDAFFDAFAQGMLEHVETLEQFRRAVTDYSAYLRDSCDFQVLAGPAPRTVKVWFAEYTAQRAA